MTRHNWRFEEVSDAGPASSLRNDLERLDVRRCLAAAARERPIRSAADVGCGYGRLTPVLAQVADRVVGFEREEALLEQARRLQRPGIEWVGISDLASLPARDGSFDFAMTFTVLQHVDDDAARRVLAELRRIAAGGFALLVEETDPSLGAEIPAGWKGGMTRGRAVATWEEWMAPWRLRLAMPRRIEPGYPRSDVGTYMLFASP